MLSKFSIDFIIYLHIKTNNLIFCAKYNTKIDTFANETFFFLRNGGSNTKLLG